MATIPWSDVQSNGPPRVDEQRTAVASGISSGNSASASGVSLETLPPATLTPATMGAPTRPSSAPSIRELSAAVGSSEVICLYINMVAPASDDE